jgi:drug/metabolite transporter (DMT)-like permease
MSRLTEIQRGVLWMIGASAAFVSTDAVAKFLVDSYPATEILCVRYVVQTVFLMALFARDLRALASSKRIALQIVRGLILVLQIGVFYVGLRFVSLASATAILFVAPLFVVALSAPILGERVSSAHWLAVSIGFLGALLVIRPGSETFQMAALFPLAAAGLFAVYQIITRVLVSTDAPRTTLFFTFVVGAVMTTAIAPLTWVPPAGTDWLFLAATGLFSGLAHFFLIKAFTAAPASRMSPLGYINLIWAAILGLAIFGEVPDPGTIIGAVLIVGGGAYIFRTAHSN